MGKVPRSDVIAPFTLALARLAFRLTKTMEAKMPMMAMTIKSSINVKPLFIRITSEIIFFYEIIFLDVNLRSPEYKWTPPGPEKLLKKMLPAQAEKNF
jgi:hypothetical protein